MADCPTPTTLKRTYIRVDPSGLRHTGQVVQQVATRFGSDLAGGPAAGTPIQAECWAVGAAAERAARGWTDLLRDLVERLDTLGQALVTVADSYAGTDARAADRTGRAVVR